MTLAGDIKYFERREIEEREAARTASSAGLSEILETVADRYADLVWSLVERQFESISTPLFEHHQTIVFEPE
jgi:hypothetical protein